MKTPGKNDEQSFDDFVDQRRESPAPTLNFRGAISSNRDTIYLCTSVIGGIQRNTVKYSSSSSYGVGIKLSSPSMVDVHVQKPIRDRSFVEQLKNYQ